MVVVDDFDEWLHLVSAGDLLFAHGFGDFSWVSVNTGNQSVSITARVTKRTLCGSGKTSREVNILKGDRMGLMMEFFREFHTLGYLYEIQCRPSLAIE